jgi:DNA gyrase/topoisomerase IV subunit A
MKTIITEQLISHDINGVPKGLVVTQATFDAEGKFVSNQRHELTAIATADLDKIRSDLTAEQAKVASEIKAKTVLEAKVATLTTEKQELRAEIADLDQALDAEQQLNTTLQAKVADLEQYRPYNPRWLDGRAFYKRISQEDMETLLASDNPQLVIVGKTILAYRDNHVQWPVILDSTDFQNLVSYVLQSGVFDMAEVTEIMRDATREEAYRVPE